MWSFTSLCVGNRSSQYGHWCGEMSMTQSSIQRARITREIGPARSGRERRGSSRHDDDGAGRVVADLVAHGTEQRVRELAVTARPDDDQRGLAARLEQHGARGALRWLDVRSVPRGRQYRIAPVRAPGTLPPVRSTRCDRAEDRSRVSNMPAAKRARRRACAGGTVRSRSPIRWLGVRSRNRRRRRPRAHSALGASSRTIATGPVATCRRCRLTEPSSRPLKPLIPRAPTTTSEASTPAASINAWAAWSQTTSRPTSLSAPTARTTSSSSTLSAISEPYSGSNGASGVAWCWTM